MNALTAFVAGLPTIAQVLITVAAVIGALGVIHSKVVAPIWRHLRAGLEDVATLRRLADDMQTTVQRELRPNGGSSMHDRLVRIEASMETYRKQADEDRKVAAADRSRIWDALLALARGSALDG